MRTVEQIEKEINDLKSLLSETKGTSTEVYTRIVGYHRAVDNWNKGKREEYKERKVFNFRQDDVEHQTFITINEKNDTDFEKAKKMDMETISIDSDYISTYKLFTSQFCRNCPPVKDYVNSLPVLGEEIDVSTELGINIAKEFGVMSTPTVIFFDKNNSAVKKAYSITEVKNTFSKMELEKVLLKN